MKSLMLPKKRNLESLPAEAEKVDKKKTLLTKEEFHEIRETKEQTRLEKVCL